MKLTRAQLEFDGRTVEYIAGDEAGQYPTPVLVINVDDFEDAQALLETLDRSRARKSAKAAPAKGNGHPEETPAHKEPPPGCIVLDCTMEGALDAETGGYFCSLHGAQEMSIRREWIAAHKKRGADRAKSAGRIMQPVPSP